MAESPFFNGLETAGAPTLWLRGVAVYKEGLTSAGQAAMLADLRAVARAAPVFTPVTPGGRKMRVGMTAAGRYGWFSDRSGYRYIAAHPSGTPWPPIPASILDVWRRVGAAERDPDCCLVNHYGAAGRMGMHQDRDEADFGWPVVSISLGDAALFRVGNVAAGAPTESVWLASGDVAVLGGEARLVHHGIDRVRFGSSALLEGGGRINVTLRVVD